MPPAPPLRRVALLYAVRHELAPLVRRLDPTPEPTPDLRHYPSFFGRLAGVTVLIAAGGVGARRAGEAAEELLSVWTPDILVMTGVAGALCPSLEIGGVVVANRIDTQDGSLIPTVVPSPAAADGGAPAHTGALLSVDRVLVTSAEKHAARGTDRLAVEMETAAVARAAVARQLPWAAVRAVSDTAAETLPLDFNMLRDEEGDLPTGRVALAALAQPSSIPGLLRLSRGANTAAAALARYLEAWLAASR